MNLETQRQNILSMLGFLHPKDRMFELYGIGAQGEITAGWFSDHEKAAEWAQKLSKGHPKGIYVTLNPCKKDLLSRADHQLKLVKTRTNNDDIASIKNITLIAFAPVNML